MFCSMMGMGGFVLVEAQVGVAEFSPIRSFVPVYIRTIQQVIWLWFHFLQCDLLTVELFL